MKWQAFFYCTVCGKEKTYCETPTYADAERGARYHADKHHNGDMKLVGVGRYDPTKMKRARLR